jgi:predicted DNA-binding transcriptional regulator AlpA
MKKENGREIMSKREVCARTTLSGTTLWRLVKSNNFPAPIKVSDGRVAWPAEAVERWMKDREAGVALARHSGSEARAA